jgi:hypothetical protein
MKGMVEYIIPYIQYHTIQLTLSALPTGPDTEMAWAEPTSRHVVKAQSGSRAPVALCLFVRRAPLPLSLGPSNVTTHGQKDGCPISLVCYSGGLLQISGSSESPPISLNCYWGSLIYAPVYI